jgi:hypothetical protein
MDPCSETICDIYHRYIGESTLSGEYILGFAIDSKLNSFSFLGSDYVYYPGAIDANVLPGTTLHVSRDSRLCRGVVDSALCTNRYVIVDCYGTRVHIKALYDGSYLFVIEIHTVESVCNVRYSEIVLRLYEDITGTKLSLYEHLAESTEYIGKIDAIRYVPISTTYMDMLYRLADAALFNDCVIINRKYDGVACWLYASRHVPLSLVAQIRTGSGVTHKYVGRLSDLPCLKSDTIYAAAAEMVIVGSSRHYIILDMFSNADEPYDERLSRCANFLDTHISHDRNVKYGWTSNTCNIRATDSYVLRPSIGSKASATAESIHGIMVPHVPDTDGYVVYVGNSRPIKVKLSTMVTLDLEYRKSSGWQRVSEKLAGRLELPSTEMLDSFQTDIVVLEVSVSSGRIVRSRPDRSRGNPSAVISSILRGYEKDVKYSVASVWCGTDVKVSILVNRMFKHYCYKKYVPVSSCIIDLGSGNGSDYATWREMHYRVLAVEVSRDRVSIMKDRVASDSNVNVLCEDMKNIRMHMSRYLIRYNTATFMRSISHLSVRSIKELLHYLVSIRVTRFIVVTMVSDYVDSHSYRDDLGQTFSINKSSTAKGVVTAIDYKVGTKRVSYRDNCYNIDQWTNIARACRLNIQIDRQADFVARAYGMKRQSSTYSCFTDVCMIMTTK